MSRKRVALTMRRPGHQTAVEAFVAGSAADNSPSTQTPTETPERAPDSGVQTSGHLEGRGMVKRRNGRVRRRRTLYLPPDLDRELAMWCAANGREVSETIAEAVSLYLERRAR